MTAKAPHDPGLVARLRAAPRCGAKNRAGNPCQAPAMKGRKRCRMHGGRSTGPKTAEGRRRCQQAAWRHGGYSQQIRSGFALLDALLGGLRDGEITSQDFGEAMGAIREAMQAAPGSDGASPR